MELLMNFEGFKVKFALVYIYRSNRRRWELIYVVTVPSFLLSSTDDWNGVNQSKGKRERGKSSCRCKNSSDIGQQPPTDPQSPLLERTSITCSIRCASSLLLPLSGPLTPSLLWGDDFSVDDLLNLEAHDAAEFEWVSFFMDDSLSEFPSCSGVALSASADGSLADGGALAGNSRKGASFLSSAVCILSTEAKVPTKAKRSKRPCRGAASAAPWSMTIGHLFQESPSNSTASSSSSSSSAPIIPPFLAHAHPPSADRRRFLLRDIPPPAKTQKPKKRGRKPKKPAAEAVESHGQRRCAHCGAHKTPQWRAGPLGAKTLCNACGVRFKSGRLLPEYRPACSPTFVGYIHSNCHRKVLEMRRKKEAPPPRPVATGFRADRDWIPGGSRLDSGRIAARIGNVVSASVADEVDRAVDASVSHAGSAAWIQVVDADVPCVAAFLAFVQQTVNEPIRKFLPFPLRFPQTEGRNDGGGEWDARARNQLISMALMCLEIFSLRILVTGTSADFKFLGTDEHRDLKACLDVRSERKQNHSQKTDSMPKLLMAALQEVKYGTAEACLAIHSDL
ncbi:hypothetical protein ZIOFF_037246 [Zingiber officinale]|uniref:GATA-type domain-containing protein n=1 Tax=Zingiber officinale TaxID=94328 RepID=A0A8J5GPP8_ZINOF|nr:hypothetical protein ZIOFF_037246 [Zingiber officinale]